MSHKTAYIWAFLIWSLILWACFFLFPKLFDSKQFNGGPAASVTYNLKPDGSNLVLITRAASEPDLKVYVLTGDRGLPVMGRVEALVDHLKFMPVAPLVGGQRYRAEWLTEDGSAQKLDFEFHHTPQRPPTVRLAPQTKLPANALKLYLHFSQPMEQGVFLERLRLLTADGKEVIGPFRETELWSPDGKRLTVWFHPGRQKTGLNLNEEEGPVLRENTKHTLVVAGSWRSTSGIPLGADVRFDFQVGPADHTMPNLDHWQITKPKAGTREPLIVTFDEPLDPAMIRSALRLEHQGQHWPVSVDVDETGTVWRGTPEAAWSLGTYEWQVNPLLEDLAGNNLQHPFEVDAEKAQPSPKTVLTRSLTLP